MNVAYDQHSASSVRGKMCFEEPMATHTSWRCGGTAARFFEPADRQDLVNYLCDVGSETEILWLGLGSNMLVRDGGLRQTVIATSPGLTRLTWIDEQVVYAESGVTCAKLAREAAAHDRAGLEFLAGIPGTVGGALRMNAGALGGEIWSFVETVETIEPGGQIQTMAASAYMPGYRNVAGERLSFLGAWFRLPQPADGAGRARIRQVIAERGETQPIGKYSCGSVFKNPPGDFAGRLIENSGFKGHRSGGAQVSVLHANFIINDGNATASDIEALIDEVIVGVEKATGVTLETEVHIVGMPPVSQPKGGQR